MIMRHAFVSRVLRACRLLSQESGIAAVEFSLILPMLLVLWIGGVEVTSALSVDRRLNNIASSIGDLVARNKDLTYTELDAIFDLGPAGMYPYDAPGMSMRVTAVQMDGTGAAKVTWSRAEGSETAYAAGQDMNSIVPVALRTADTQLIMAEVYYTYTPAVGYVITGAIDMEDRMFFVPRVVSKIALCATDQSTSCTS